MHRLRQSYTFNFFSTNRIFQNSEEFSAQFHANCKVPKKFKEIPGPSKFDLFKGFSKNGKYYQKSMPEFQKMVRDEYGGICRIPGMFGQRSTVMAFDAEIIEEVHRNEGMHPIRRELVVMKYYRTKIRPEIYKVGGLIIE